MRRSCFGLLFCAMIASAASPGSSVVEARMVLATNAAYPNSDVKAAVVARIAPGYHINDHRPSLDYLIATDLKIDGNDRVSVEKVDYPTGKSLKFEFSDAPLSVYEGTLLVGVLLKVARTAHPGLYSIHGKLTYQACNDHACLPPAGAPLTLTLKVVRPGVPLKPKNTDVFGKIKLE